MQYSLDSGASWSAIASVAATGSKLATNGTQWMAIAAGSASKNITCSYTPTIASSWTQVNIGSSQGIFGIGWIPYLNLWLVGVYHGLFSSSDGFNWSGRTVGITLDGATGFASDNTYVVLVSAPYNTGGSSVVYSTDAGVWSVPTGSAVGNRFFSGGGCVATNGSGAWVAGGYQNATYNNTLAHAANGPTSAWVADGSGFFTTSCNAIAWGNSTWVAGGSGTNTLAYSTQTCPSGSSAWTAVASSPFSTICNSITWTGTNFVAFGVSAGAGVVATSANGITWTTNTAPTGMSAATAITYSNYNNLTTTVAPLTNINVGLGSATLNFANIYANTITLASGSTITSSTAGSGETINLGNISITANTNDSLAIGNQAGAEGQGSYDVAIGYQAGNSTQGAYAVALGYQAGFTGQKDYSIAIGYQAGYTGHGTGSIAIGYLAGNQDSIGPNSVAIGTQAGQYGLGTNSIAIGYLAGPTGTSFSNNIILNAQGTGLSPNTGSAFYAAPIRNTNGSTTTVDDTSGILFYNSVTDEITFAPTISLFTIGSSTFGISRASSMTFRGLTLSHTSTTTIGFTTPLSGTNVYSRVETGNGGSSTSPITITVPTMAGVGEMVSYIIVNTGASVKYRVTVLVLTYTDATTYTWMGTIEICS